MGLWYLPAPPKVLWWPPSLDRRRAWNLVAFGLLVSLAIGGAALTVATVTTPGRMLASDAFDYWSAWHHDLYLSGGLIWDHAYLYSPAFAELLLPLTLLPWSAFATIWLLLATGAYLWLLWPLTPPLRFAALAFVLCAIAPVGNIEWAVALVAVAMRRLPPLVSLPLLTKVAPGVSVLWFAFRREWRQLILAIGGTVLIVVLSAVIAPSLWVAWWQTLWTNATAGRSDLFMGVLVVPPLWARGSIALVTLAWCARRGSAWGIPLAMLLAQPDLSLASFGILAALPRLDRSAPVPRRRAVAARVDPLPAQTGSCRIPDSGPA
jgi:Glycosyltransferase family 87